MSVTAPPRPLPMEKIGPYDLLAAIAEGGMGTVYKGRDQRTGDTVAVKVLLPSIATRPVLLKRFRQEFRAASSLDHPHMVRALDFGEDGGHHFLVLEYVDGLSLGEIIESHGRMPEAQAVGLIVQAAEALHHAHERGFLHRDVKPDNILVDAAGNAKVTDLGLAKELDADLNLTHAGKGLGTPYFMAPEQLADAKHVDRRADIYGLGATLYLVVTGELPFRTRGFLNIFKKKTAGDITPPSKLAPGLSERLDRTILKALSAEPEQRQATCQEFITELTGKRSAPPARKSRARPAAVASSRERRATLRYPSQQEGICLPLCGETEVRWSAQVRDVSADGLSLLVNRRFEPGTVLTVEFQGRKANRPDCLLVRVVRAQEQPRRKWLLGCKFSKRLSEDEVEALQ